MTRLRVTFSGGEAVEVDATAAEATRLRAAAAEARAPLAPLARLAAMLRRPPVDKYDRGQASDLRARAGCEASRLRASAGQRRANAFVASCSGYFDLGREETAAAEAEECTAKALDAALREAAE